MPKNTPAFQYYPADLISDPDVMFWDMERVGCYWQMITYLWLNGGKFVFNAANLRVLFKVKRDLRARKLWGNVAEKFVLEDGIVTHRRVTVEMQRQAAARVKRQKAGRKGAESRWGGDGNAKETAMANGMAKNAPSSSIFHLSSSNSSTPMAGRSFSLQQFYDEGALQGVPEADAKVCFEHYGAQGWKFGNGLEIPDARAAITKWRLNRPKYKKEKLDADSGRETGFAEQKSDIGEVIDD